MANTIRSFIYLDEQKLYSCSSQIFEGLTEYIVHTRKTAQGETVSTPPGIESEEILATILKETSATQEKRFLFDHAYRLVEEKLIANGAVIDIDKRKSYTLQNREDHQFMRIKGTISFNDYLLTRKFIKEFNSLGMAIAYLEHHNRLPKDSPNETELTSFLEKQASDDGLRADPKMLECLNKLLEFGFEDFFEIRIQFPVDDKGSTSAFSSVLKRECLREPENIILRKYGRKTEREFTLFGVVSQGGPLPTNGTGSSLGAASDETMRAHLLKMVDQFFNLDRLMSGRASKEVIIDPIALYLDVGTRT